MKIKARVCKGFITRFSKEEEWDEYLIPFNEKELHVYEQVVDGWLE